MAYTEDQLAALQEALAKGERRVSFADKTVEYRTIDEIRQALREVQKGLLRQAVETGQGLRAPRQVRIDTGKGA